MRNIIVGAQVSIDGVMQAPGGQTEDPTGGFRFGGWAMAYFSPEFGEEIQHLFDQPFHLLLGRKTYEIFAAYWPFQDEGAPHGGIARMFNQATKYVVSRSGEVDTGWTNSVLLRDLAEVKVLQMQDGPILLTQGSPGLVQALFACDLVDALSLYTVPVVLGGGKKLFSSGAAPHAFRLVRSRVAPNGLIVGHYEREGEVRIGDAGLGSPSELELARQKRMQREG